MGIYLVAALLVPHFLNELDKLAGKLMNLYRAWRYR